MVSIDISIDFSGVSFMSILTTVYFVNVLKQYLQKYILNTTIIEHFYNLMEKLQLCTMVTLPVKNRQNAYWTTK